MWFWLFIRHLLENAGAAENLNQCILNVNRHDSNSSSLKERSTNKRARKVANFAKGVQKKEWSDDDDIPSYNLYTTWSEYFNDDDWTLLDDGNSGLELF
jgi:hypothetical protein